MSPPAAAVEASGAVQVVATRPWPGSAVAVSPDGAWAAVALPGRVMVARLPDLEGAREIAVADVRSLAAVGTDRLALAPRRGLLVITDPAGAPAVGLRARGPGRLVLAAGPGGRLAAVGPRAALPRATVIARSDAARRRDWTAAVAGASSAAWLDGDDLVIGAGEDLVLVRRGEEHARARSPIGEPIMALAAIPGGVAIAGAGGRAVLHSVIPGRARPSVGIPPGAGRGLAASGGILVSSTRSLGERVTAHGLRDGREVGGLRGVSAGAPAPPYLVATGREGTVVAVMG